MAEYKLMIDKQMNKRWLITFGILREYCYDINITITWYHCANQFKFVTGIV